MKKYSLQIILRYRVYLIKIIKTAYLRNKDRIDNNKKIGEKDNNYFNLAERYLYTEFSIVLNKNFEDTKDYVIEKVMEIEAQQLIYYSNMEIL